MPPITSHNWLDHCTEPPLTRAEAARWRDLVLAMAADPALDDRIHAATVTERAAFMAAQRITTADWSDVVAWADAWRRLQRAELAAWGSGGEG